VLVEHPCVAAVDDGLAVDDAANPARRALEIQQTVAVELRVELAAGEVPEGSRADSQ
jgi:hypothetical protein